MPRYIYSLILILATGLSGCSKPEGRSLLEDYLYRLGNSLDIEVNDELDDLPPAVAYPARRTRLVEPLVIREGFIDTLKLGECNLLNLVAERNSSLGRVMPVSSQLIYELKFFDGIHHCRQQPAVRTDPELLTHIDAIYRLKKQNLPRVLWNAIYNAPEMEAQFSLGEPPLPPNTQATISPVINSLKQLKQLAQQTSSTDNWRMPSQLDVLESHYQILNSNRFGAQWLSSTRLLTATLNRAASALEARLQGRALCPMGRPTPKAKILHTVFRKYYAGQVQPYMAQVHKSGQQWLTLHQEILKQMAFSDRLASYQQQVLSPQGKLWQDYIDARNRHTKAWQMQLGQCGMMPGSA